MIDNIVKIYLSADKCRRNKEYYSKTQNAVNRQKKYTEPELILIWEHKTTDHEISKQIGRSVQAIQGVRHKIKSGVLKLDFKL